MLNTHSLTLLLSPHFWALLTKDTAAAAWLQQQQQQQQHQTLNTHTQAKIPSFLLFTFPIFPSKQTNISTDDVKTENKSPGRRRCSEAHSIRTIVLQLFFACSADVMKSASSLSKLSEAQTEKKRAEWELAVSLETSVNFHFPLLPLSPFFFPPPPFLWQNVKCHVMDCRVLLCVCLSEEKRWLGTAILLGLRSWILGKCCCCFCYSWCKRARKRKKKRKQKRVRQPYLDGCCCCCCSSSSQEKKRREKFVSALTER